MSAAEQEALISHSRSNSTTNQSPRNNNNPINNSNPTPSPSPEELPQNNTAGGLFSKLKSS